jgi:hypothetical protein
MSEVKVEVAPLLTELDPKLFSISEKKKKSWNFKNKEGKQQTGSKDFVELYYGKPPNRLSFIINDVKSFNGIQTSSSNMKKAFMSLPVKEDLHKDIVKHLDTPVCNLLFQHKQKLLKQASKIHDMGGMSVIYEGIITPGKPKAEGSEEKWGDQLTGNVYMKKKNQQWTVDDNQCTVEDLNGKTYSWTNLDNKLLKEACLEVESIVLGDKIKINFVYKSLVPEGEDRPKTVSRRKMDQMKEQEQQRRDKKRTHDEMTGGESDGGDNGASAGGTGAGGAGTSGPTGTSTSNPPKADTSGKTGEPDTKKAKTS